MTEDEIVAAAIVIKARDALNEALASQDLEDLPEIDLVLFAGEDEVVDAAREIPTSVVIAGLIHMRDLLEMRIQQMCGTVQ